MKVKVNDRFNFEVAVENGQLKVDDAIVNVDTEVLADGSAHVLYNNKSYNIELITENNLDKTLIIKVNGSVYHIAIEDQYDQLLKKLGLDGAQSNKVSEIKAPMPGLVLNVMVAEGQSVEKGDSLLVLEAMKMENVIKSPTSGLIKKILISKGIKVEKNEILIQF